MKLEGACCHCDTLNVLQRCMFVTFVLRNVSDETKDDSKERSILLAPTQAFVRESDDGKSSYCRWKKGDRLTEQILLLAHSLAFTRVSDNRNLCSCKETKCDSKEQIMLLTLAQAFVRVRDDDKMKQKMIVKSRTSGTHKFMS